MEILKEIRERYSAKNFLKREVEKEKIMRILEAGHLSPSAKNKQSWRFVVLTKADLKEKMKECCFEQDFVSDAGAIITLCTTSINYKMPNGHLSYPIDLGIVSAFMMLQATKDGLVTCPIGTFDERKVAKLLTIPYSMRAVLILLVGYENKEDKKNTRDRIPLSKVISFEHW